MHLDWDFTWRNADCFVLSLCLHSHGLSPSPATSPADPAAGRLLLPARALTPGSTIWRNAVAFRPVAMPCSPRGQEAWRDRAGNILLEKEKSLLRPCVVVSGTYPQLAAPPPPLFDFQLF